MKNIEINQLFVEIGLDDKCAAIYLKLLSTGEMSMGQLSKSSSIPKTTLYRIISRLQDLSLISIIYRGDTKFFVAEPPEKLELIIKDKQINLASQMATLEELTDKLPIFLKSIFEGVAISTKFNQPLVSYFEGLQGLISLTNRSLDKADSEILQVSNCTEWRKAFTKEYAHVNYIPKRLERNINVRALVLDNAAGREFKKQDVGINRQTRFLPKGIDFKSTILIYKGEVSIMLSSRPYAAILIQDVDASNLFKGLFEVAWLRQQ